MRTAGASQFKIWRSGRERRHSRRIPGRSWPRAGDPSRPGRRKVGVVSEPIRYQLKHPLTLTLRGPEGERQETKTELTLRRLRGKDLRGMSPGTSDEEKGLLLIGRSTGLSALEVDELDLEDIAGLGEVVEGFIPDGLKTGPIR